MYKRQLLALGRADVGDLESLLPREPGLTVIGGSSDHRIVDVEDCPRRLQVGDIVEFSLCYSHMLYATSRSDKMCIRDRCSFTRFAMYSADFVSNAMANVGDLRMFLPAIIFIIGAAIGFATGTSWGTIGIMAPIVVSVFNYDAEPILCTIGLAAACSGGVMGDHCSPISDTTIMASAGAHCYHLNHVFTQIPYALTVAGVSFVSFILAGLI